MFILVVMLHNPDVALAAWGVAVALTAAVGAARGGELAVAQGLLAAFLLNCVAIVAALVLVFALVPHALNAFNAVILPLLALNTGGVVAVPFALAGAWRGRRRTARHELPSPDMA